MTSSTRGDIDRIQWLRANRGILSRCAGKTHCTPQFVRLVFWGARQSSDGRVERFLRRHGAIIPQRRRRRNV